jgi:limonene-1,2-epoxide hydrolase
MYRGSLCSDGPGLRPARQYVDTVRDVGLERGPAMDAKETALREVLDALSESVEHAQDAIRTHFADDCIWQQSGLPTTTGPDEAVALLDSLAESIKMATLDVEYLHVASNDDVVFTERIDWLVTRDGDRLGPTVVVGVTEFKDGKIVHWREYFDTSGLIDAMEEPGR